jgi:hypothetical protein
MRTSVVLLYNTLRVVTWTDDDEVVSDVIIDLDNTGAGDNDSVITVFHADSNDVRIGHGIAQACLPEIDCFTQKLSW